MSERIKDGGPAFPVEYLDRAMFEDMQPGMGILQAKAAATVNAPGMSLRDYFAAKAMQAVASILIAADEALVANTMIKKGAGTVEELAAVLSYDYADAMLAARETKP